MSVYCFMVQQTTRLNLNRVATTRSYSVSSLNELSFFTASPPSEKHLNNLIRFIASPVTLLVAYEMVKNNKQVMLTPGLSPKTPEGYPDLEFFEVLSKDYITGTFTFNCTRERGYIRNTWRDVIVCKAIEMVLSS